MFIVVTDAGSDASVLVNVRHIVTVMPAIGAAIELLDGRGIRTRESWVEVKAMILQATAGRG